MISYATKPSGIPCCILLDILHFQEIININFKFIVVLNGIFIFIVDTQFHIFPYLLHPTR